jgi:hypothetical protein
VGWKGKNGCTGYTWISRSGRGRLLRSRELTAHPNRDAHVPERIPRQTQMQQSVTAQKTPRRIPSLCSTTHFGLPGSRFRGGQCSQTDALRSQTDARPEVTPILIHSAHKLMQSVARRGKSAGSMARCGWSRFRVFFSRRRRARAVGPYVLRK